MKCLFIIDVQNGFVSDKTEHVVPRILKLMQRFSGQLVIATQYINKEKSAFSEIMHWKGLKDSPDIDLIDGIQKRASNVVKKYTYTACTEEVTKILKKNKITEVYLAGIDTDCCVLKTAIDLFEMNIRPIVLANYCASNGGIESHESAIKVLNRTIGYEQISNIFFD